MAAMKAFPFALRFMPTAQEQGCGRLLASALSRSSSTTSSAGVASTEGQAMAAEMKVAQYSSSEAAALAAKQQHITGLGSLQSTRSMSSFASSKGFSTSSSSSAAAAVAAAEPAKEKASFFSTMAKVAAALLGAVALALAPPAAADAPANWQWMFQDSATSNAQAMQDLHHDVMFFVLTVGVLVLYLTFQFVSKFHYAKAGPLSEKLTHHTTLEVLWTVFPTVVILLIGIPSLTLIYSMDQHTDRPGLTVKIIGRQWYWSYEMHDHLQHKLVDPDRLVAIAEKSLRA